MALEINVMIAAPGSHMLLYHPVSYIAEAAVQIYVFYVSLAGSMHTLINNVSD